MRIDSFELQQIDLLYVRKRQNEPSDRFSTKNLYLPCGIWRCCVSRRAYCTVFYEVESTSKPQEKRPI